MTRCIVLLRFLSLCAALVGLLLPGESRVRDLAPLDAEVRLYLALGGDLSDLCGDDPAQGHGETCLLCLTPGLLPDLAEPGRPARAEARRLAPAFVTVPAPRHGGPGLPPARAPPVALV